MSVMPNPIRILLIDDDKVTNLIHSAIIRRLEVPTDVHCCMLAEDALSYLNSVEEWPHFIFLDLNMPIIDGWGFLEEIKGTEIPSALYILSSSIDPSDIERSEKYNQVEGFISKPLTLEKLQQALTSMASRNS